MANNRCAALRCLLALTLCISGTPESVKAGTGPHPRREVLPADVIPIHYELALAPNAEALTFTGRVSITLRVVAPTASITLNAAGLTFDHASLDGGPGPKVILNEKLGRATLDFGKTIPSGQHVLSIDYHGNIGRATTGFFAMDYRGPDGPRRTLATNFEPTDARDLLPCWDEPGRKATFTVSIDVPRQRMAVSNMPIAAVTPLSPSLQRVRFQQSPKMSTYLLFVGVGDFERVQKRVDGVDVGVVVKRGDTGKATYALEQAGRLLHYYNEYFGVPYPLPKLDLIAAPGQLEGGSMENWGAIFYSQNHLLFDPQTSTEYDRQVVFLVVAHEMAHQWFGDLVTMAWWDDLWLNEGFARWMQTYAADELHPEWDTGLQAAEIYEAGKQADSVPSTHPVVQEVDTADQAQESFDSITYDKGAAIITMINAYAGREKFRDGVRRYMRAHAFGNTVDTDLWLPIQQAAGRPIVEIERDFTRQEGLPLVRAGRAAAGVNLTQTRFADDPATISHLPPQHWRLPLAVGPLEGAKHYILLRGTAELSTPPPLLVNAGQLGYARVLYDSESFDGLASHLDVLPAMDQLGIFNDSWALGIAGYAPASNVVRIAAQLPAQANPVVWGRVLEVFANLDRHYASAPQREAFRQFALRVLNPLAVRLGSHASEQEPANLQILRSRLQEAQARFGDAAVIAAARRRLDSGEGTAAERRAALNIVAAQADAPTFDTLLARAQRISDPLEKLHLLRALASVADQSLARRMVDVALGDQVPSGSSPGLIDALAREHPDMVWEVLAPQLDDPKLPFSKSQRWELAAQIAAYSAAPQRIADLEAYEARSVPPEARKPFLGAVADIRTNERIAQNVLPDIDRWIAAQRSSPSTAPSALTGAAQALR
ncbi:MAG TPA: M1 family metallopeptidase [Steroidobacteraceae bacterium]|nr:M1 family metallopeptidase [Steroidobacteraceae bacterium]